MASIVELWKVGDLTACVTAALAAVREEPADRAARHGLAELLLFAGDLERADKHLDFLANAADPNDMMRVLMLRRLIRAETTRREVFAQGRAPQLLAAPPANFKPTLEALVCLREHRGELQQLLRPLRVSAGTG